MAFEALRSTLRRGQPQPDQPAEPVRWGEGQVAAGSFSMVAPDPTTGSETDRVFGCPSCGRAIPRGSLRCAGCGQLLVLDVPLRRAAGLAGGGAVAGILVTTLLVNLLAPAKPAVAGAGTGIEGQGGGGTTSGQAIGVTAGAAAALRGTTAIDGRLAAQAEPLAAAIAGKSTRVTDVVKVFRRLSADTRAGAGMVTALSTWPSAAAQQAALASFYDELGGQLDKALAVSQTNTAAYRAAAKSVLTTLGRIPQLDADARLLGVQGNVQLAPVTIPDVLAK